jgi:hypothetical protein
MLGARGLHLQLSLPSTSIALSAETFEISGRLPTTHSYPRAHYWTIFPLTCFGCLSFGYDIARRYDVAFQLRESQQRELTRRLSRTARDAPQARPGSMVVSGDGEVSVSSMAGHVVPPLHDSPLRNLHPSQAAGLDGAG